MATTTLTASNWFVDDKEDEDEVRSVLAQCAILKREAALLPHLSTTKFFLAALNEFENMIYSETCRYIGVSLYHSCSHGEDGLAISALNEIEAVDRQGMDAEYAEDRWLYDDLVRFMHVPEELRDRWEMMNREIGEQSLVALACACAAPKTPAGRWWARDGDGAMVSRLKAFTFF